MRMTSCKIYLTETQMKTLHFTRESLESGEDRPINLALGRWKRSRVRGHPSRLQLKFKTSMWATGHHVSNHSYPTQERNALSPCLKWSHHDHYIHQILWLPKHSCTFQRHFKKWIGRELLRCWSRFLPSLGSDYIVCILCSATTGNSSHCAFK